jgi:hypothetical protein
MRSLIRGSVLMISPSYVVINMQTRKKRAKMKPKFLFLTLPVRRNELGGISPLAAYSRSMPEV